MSLALLAAAALAAPCPAPTIRTTLFESPEVLVTEAKPRRAGGVVYRDAIVCDRVTGRRTRAWSRFSGGGAAGGGLVTALFAGRYLEVEEWGGGAESDATTRRLLDVRTGRWTSAVTVDGTEDEGDEEVAGPGFLAQLVRGDRARVMVRRPGGGSRALPAGTPNDGGLALATRTVYWQARGAVQSSRVSLPVVPAARRAATRGLKGAKGRCEPRGARTLLRTKGFRVFRAAGSGTIVACSRARGRARPLTTLVPGAPAAGPPEQLQQFDGASLAYRYPTSGGGMAYVIADLTEPRADHALVLPAPAAGVAFHREGIATTGPGGVTFARGTGPGATTALTPTTDALEPAIATTGDGIAVYWTAPDGPHVGRIAVAVEAP